MKKSRCALIALTASVLGLSACGSGDDAATPEQSVTSTSPAESTESSSPPSSASSGQTSPETIDPSSSADDGGLSSVLTAIDAAVTHGKGTAHEVDDIDDQRGAKGWEVDIAKDERSVELTVSEDGDVTKGKESDLDADVRAGLKEAKVDLAPAIETAMKAVKGDFKDAELDEVDGTHYWKVEIATDTGEEKVLVGVVDGEIVEAR